MKGISQERLGNIQMQISLFKKNNAQHYERIRRAQQTFVEEQAYIKKGTKKKFMLGKRLKTQNPPLFPMTIRESELTVEIKGKGVDASYTNFTRNIVKLELEQRNSAKSFCKKIVYEF